MSDNSSSNKVLAMPSPGAPIDSYFSYSLAAAYRTIHLDLSNELKKLGVQVETWRLLQTLRHDENFSMTELADIVLLNPPTFTKLVDRMVADGLVQRQLNQQDNRRVQLQLTKLGVELYEQIATCVQAQDVRITKAIGENKMVLLREALETLA